MITDGGDRVKVIWWGAPPGFSPIYIVLQVTVLHVKSTAHKLMLITMFWQA